MGTPPPDARPRGLASAPSARRPFPLGGLAVAPVRARRDAAADDRLLRLQHPRRHDQRRRLPRVPEDAGRAKAGAPVELVSSFAGSGTVTNQVILGVPGRARAALARDRRRPARRRRRRARREPGGAAPRGCRQPDPLRHPRAAREPEGASATSPTSRGPGVRVVHPDPLTSGGANWAIVAEYGAGARATPGDPDGGRPACSLGIWKNVVAQAASARAARTQFENGFGDALITYEQEALCGPGARTSSTRTSSTLAGPIFSEHTLVSSTGTSGRGNGALVDAFVRFPLERGGAAGSSSRHGFRSVEEPLNAGNPAFGADRGCRFCIADFGGWRSAPKRDRGRRLEGARAEGARVEVSAASLAALGAGRSRGSACVGPGLDPRRSSCCRCSSCRSRAVFVFAFRGGLPRLLARRPRLPRRSSRCASRLLDRVRDGRGQRGARDVRGLRPLAATASRASARSGSS